MGSPVRCPKCKRAFDVSDESIDEGKEFLAQMRALPVSERGICCGRNSWHADRRCRGRKSRWPPH